jgi:hypothetical protein
MGKLNRKTNLPENWGRMSEMDRRSFLEWSLKLTTLMAVAPALRPADAEASNYNNRPSRFVNFFIRGGSCQLSSYLAPTADRSSLASLPSHWKTPGLATSFRPTSAAKATEENVDISTSMTYGSESQGSQPLFHARTPVGNYFLPLLWSSNIPVGTGTGVASMKSLIQTNCALLYGLESAPAHPLAEVMLLDPEPGSQTVGGYISALSGAAFFPAIANSGGVRPYKGLSGSGLRIFQPDGTNGGPALDLLRAVNPETNEVSSNAGRRAWFNQLRTKMLESVESMRITNMITRPGISELYHLLTQAQQSVDTGTYTTVLTDFTATLSKYSALLERARVMAMTQMQGITDSATLASNPVVSRLILRQFTESNSLKSISNISSLFAGGSQLTVSASFAYTFAMAEVALRNNLTHVLQLGLGEGMVQMKYVLKDGVAENTGAAFDNHARGVVANLISNAAFYYIFNTLLYELRRNIQGITSSPGTLTTVPMTAITQINDSATGTPAPPAPDPWRDTVILVNTEFSRNPDSNGGGSQHGYHGSCAALFSGRIAGNLKVLGRTTYGNAQNGYPNSPGAWGRGAPHMMLNSGRQVSFKDLGATLAALYGTADSLPQNLKTLLDRSEMLFSLNPTTGNIEFGQKLPTYALVNP